MAAGVGRTVERRQPRPRRVRGPDPRCRAQTWLGACHATFDAYWSAQATALAATKESTDKALAIANPYDRLQAFADLPRGPVAVPNDPARYELEAATARAFLALGRASTYQTEKYYPSVDLRPAFDEASERDLFCWKASKGLEITEGRVRKLVMPKAPEGDEHLDAIVKPLFDEAKIKPLVEKAATARADAEAFFRMKDAPAAPEMKGGTIKTVTRKGDAVVVTLYSESSGVTQDKTRCVWVSAAQVSCPTVNLKTEETTTITFTDLPASITLREGDALSLRGKQLSRTSSPKAGAGESVDKVTIVFEPAFLDAYQRGSGWTHTPTAGKFAR